MNIYNYVKLQMNWPLKFMTCYMSLMNQVFISSFAANKETHNRRLQSPADQNFNHVSDHHHRHRRQKLLNLDALEMSAHRHLPDSHCRLSSLLKTRINQASERVSRDPLMCETLSYLTSRFF